jgi:N-hydroxyarylamine O-acetyltransferase
MIPQYLERIGYSGSLDPSSDTLRALHEHHMLAVPFENLDIHLGRPITCEVGRFFEKIVTRRRGGFCYELNGLFAELLRGIGFEVELLSGRVRTETSGFGPEFDHMALLVHSDRERWLADVGFGDSFVRPLRMDTGQLQLDPAGEFRIAKEGEGCTLFRDDTPEYRFTLTPRSLEEFGPMCHYQQTSPDSVFTKKRVCSRATTEGRITVTASKLIVTSNGERTERDLPDDAAWRDALREHFEIVL